MTTWIHGGRAPSTAPGRSGSLPWLIACLLLLSAAALAQPAVTEVVDGATYTGGIPQGAVFVVKGTGLSAAGYVAADAPSYPTTLNSVSIKFTPAGGGTAVQVLMVYTYNQSGVNQLAGVLPSTTAVGSYNVTVTNGSATSAPFQANVVARKPGIVTANGSGSGPAQATLAGDLILQRFADVGKIGTFSTRAARPGDRLDLWGTGLGADVASDTGGTSGNQTAAAQVRVIVDGVPLTPAYAGRSQGFPGLDQYVVTLPANLRLGCFITVVVVANGVAGNPTTIATSTSSACSDPVLSREQLDRLSKGGTLTGGTFSISSVAFEFPSLNIPGIPNLPPGVEIPGLGGASYAESIGGAFSRFGASLGAGIPIGTTLNACFVQRVTGSVDSILSTVPDVVTLDAGTLTVTKPNGSPVTLTKVEGTYSANLGASGSAATLVPGNYQLAGTGGSDIGAFSTSVSVPQFEWTNRTAITEVNRGQGLTVNWSGGGSGWVNIIGFSGNSIGGSLDDFENATFSGGFFGCLVPASAHTYTVAASILQQLDAAEFSLESAQGGNFAIGYLGVIATNSEQQGNFTAPLTAGGNTDFGFFGYSLGGSKILSYK